MSGFISGEEKNADDDGQNCFHDIAEEDGNARLKSQMGHDIGHAGIAGSTKFFTGLSSELTADNFSRQETTKGIADQQT